MSVSCAEQLSGMSNEQYNNDLRKEINNKIIEATKQTPSVCSIEMAGLTSQVHTELLELGYAVRIAGTNDAKQDVHRISWLSMKTI